jgi:RNA polymerase sigma factor (TIGR02999 family)
MYQDEELTQLLARWSEGDQNAMERLTPLIYNELRRRAAAYLQRESDAGILQATALVHEAYIQILELRNIKWQSRAHFINTVAMLMRRVLVDHARGRRAEKRGSGQRSVTLGLAEDIGTGDDLDIVDLNEALERLSKVYPRQAHVVELKFFGGLSVQEIAEVLTAEEAGISPRTVERDWTFARTWLHREMKSN